MNTRTRTQTASQNHQAHQAGSHQQRQAVKNRVYNQGINTVDWLAVRVVADHIRNPRRHENGLWKAVSAENRILAEGTKAHCDEYALNSKREYAKVYGKELRARIDLLLSLARGKSGEEILLGKSLSEQQVLIEAVHTMTGTAIELASWISEDFAEWIKDAALDIRSYASLTFCGQKLWNIKIYAETEEDALDIFSRAKNVVLTDVEREKGTPKFMTHQVLCDGKAVAKGMVQACVMFIRTSEEVIKREEKFEAGKVQAQKRILEILGEARERLGRGEPFAGKVQSLVASAFSLAKEYELNSGPIQRVCSDAVSSVSLHYCALAAANS